MKRNDLAKIDIDNDNDKEKDNDNNPDGEAEKQRSKVFQLKLTPAATLVSQIVMPRHLLNHSDDGKDEKDEEPGSTSV